MSKEKFIKYGGAKFKIKSSGQKINKYVDQLPDNKKDSLYEVAKELDKAGLIDLINDGTFSTIGERPSKNSPDCN